MLTVRSFIAGAMALGAAAIMALAMPAAAQVRGSAAVGATAQPGVDTSLADSQLDRALDGAVPQERGRRDDGWRDDGWRDDGWRGDARRDDARGRDGGSVRGRDGGSVRGRDATRYDEYTDSQRRYTERYRRDEDRNRDYRRAPYDYRDRDYRRDHDYRDPPRVTGGVRYSGGRDWNRRYRDGASVSIGVDLGDVTIGYRSGFRDGYYVYYDGRHRYRHRDWRRGYTRRYDCHPVHYSEWFRGRRVPVAATMCYDRYGYGYIVPGSERRQYYW